MAVLLGFPVNEELGSSKAILFPSKRKGNF